MDLTQLADNLFARKAKKEVSSNKGIANAINFVWNRYGTRQVDFSSFTYEDACQAIDIFGSVPTDEDEDERMEDYIFTGLDYFNANEAVVVKLIRTKCALEPIEEDDFL